ncbi:MAG: Ppx/GppA family phosphatase [Balneolaceae bacterium]|nr:MAG: Ppx/GppA family phosphatase [Balneolaceae bacterium]
MLCASVDIGTNSVLLLIAEVTDGKLRVIKEEQELPRLGRGVDGSGQLHPDSRLRVIDSLKRYYDILRETESELPSRTIVTATSAVRDAANRNEFLAEIEAETGWRVRVLSGEEEARITYRGALRVLRETEQKPFMVIDIGGGSTELAGGKGMQYSGGISLDIGSVRFSERFLSADPPGLTELLAAKSAVREAVPVSFFSESESEIVGVAGTITTIAAVILELEDYQPGILNGYQLKLEDLDRFIEQISHIASSEIEKINPFFLRGRADVILAGAVILQGIMKKAGKESLKVSTGGIRHGLL